MVVEPQGAAPEPPAEPAPPVMIVLPPEPEPAVDLEEPAVEKAPETKSQETGPPGERDKPQVPGVAGSWHIRTLQNGEGS